ncbi:MAG TPA: tetratricopeptide repeat protein [Methylomirabilota bacterium]|nr:tetratricopeptide repeat protein [Methylomirabilota bacterium]
MRAPRRLRALWGQRRVPGPVTMVEALRRAEQQRREGRYPEATQLVTVALALDPANLTAHLLAAYLHAARRATNAAKSEFRWVLDHDPNHARALLGLARVTLEEGDTAASDDLLRRALRLYPDFPEAAALREAVRARREAAPAGEPARPAPRVDRLRLPGTGRALLIARCDGTLLAAQPPAADAPAAAETLTGLLRLASATLARAGVGAVRRALVEDARDAVFARTDSAVIVALTLPRTTDPPQGVLDVNRLWAATLHELGLAASSTPVSASAPAPPAVDPRRRAS